MTKLQIFSDLHFDEIPMVWTPALAAGADVVVCAGDVCEGLPEAFAFLRGFLPKPTPIVTVAGNHSFYNRVLEEEWRAARLAADVHDITLLENESAVIGGVRFIGATLWTDYTLEADPAAAILAARRGLNDHRCIALRRTPPVPFLPSHAQNKHASSVRAIDDGLATLFDGPTVVLTHHAPHPRSIAAAYRGNRLNAAFASDLGWLIERHQPELWVHGHTHTSFDYRIGRTRIVCNPHGYGRENIHGFDPALVVDLPSRNIQSGEA